MTRDDFDRWVFKMEDDLNDFFAQLPEDVRGGLDYSPGSLDVLEKWLLDRYPSPQALLQPSEKYTFDGAARYIGETFRKQAGGHWTIDLDNPENVFFQLPVLTRRSGPDSPFSLAGATTDRRTGSYLRTVLENTIELEQAQPSRP